MKGEHRVYQGMLVGSGKRFALVVARFNQFITDRLCESAIDTLRRHGVADEDIEIAWVPGAFEIPLVARRMAESGRFAAVCCLGTIIRGATPHFDHVATQAARGIAQAAWDSGVPVIFGVLTTDSIEQAIERAGTKAGNKGGEAATNALEMAQLMDSLAGISSGGGR